MLGPTFRFVAEKTDPASYAPGCTHFAMRICVGQPGPGVERSLTAMESDHMLGALPGARGVEISWERHCETFIESLMPAEFEEIRGLILGLSMAAGKRLTRESRQALTGFPRADVTPNWYDDKR